MAKNIKANAFASVMVKVFNILFPLITGPYLARILSKEAYGDFNVANSVMGLFLPFAAFGVYSYGIRSISRVKNNIENINKIFSILFIISLLSSVSAGIMYLIYMFFYVSSNMYILYFSLSIQIFTQFVYIEWMNEAFENYGFILFKTLFVRILMLCSIFLFVKKAEDIINYALILSLTNLINYLISFIYIKTKVKFVKFKFKEIIFHIKPLIGMLILSNSYLLYTTLDRLVLSMLGAKIQVTYYSFSLSISQLITSVVYSIIIVSLPRLSFYYGTEDEKNYTSLLNRVTKSFFFIVIPMGIGLACVSTEAIFIYAGTKYLESAFILMLFSLRIVLWSLDQSLSMEVLFVRGYEKYITIFYFIGGFLNLFLNFILFKNKVEQAQYYVYTTIISELFVVIIIISFIIRNKIVKIKEILKAYFKYIICAIPFFIINYFLNKFLPFITKIDLKFLLRLIIIMSSCSIYYFLIMLITKEEILLFTLDVIKIKLRLIKNRIRTILIRR